MSEMHEIDYQVFGNEMQFVEIELDPQEAVVAEAGGMMFMEDDIEMRPSSAMAPSRTPASSAPSWALENGCSPANPFS